MQFNSLKPLKVPISNNNQSVMVDWKCIGRVVTQTQDGASQTLGVAFQILDQPFGFILKLILPGFNKIIVAVVKIFIIVRP